MNTFTVITSLLGALGLSAILNTIIQSFLQSKLEKNKILFDKKFDIYSDFCEFVLGFNSDKKEFFKARAATAKVRMLVINENLEDKIDDFVFELDHLEELSKKAHQETDIKKRSELDKERIKKIGELDKAGTEIIKELKKDLNETLKTDSFWNRLKKILFLKLW